MTLTTLEKALRLQTEAEETLFKALLAQKMIVISIKEITREKKGIDKLVKQLKKQASGK